MGLFPEIPIIPTFPEIPENSPKKKTHPFNTTNFSFLIIFSIFADWNIINIKLK